MIDPALRVGDEPSSEKHTQILDAAERRFSRAGFHRTTMQDVAAEAGMSPGNLYRYFASKDALVIGLCERDRATLGHEFSSLYQGADFLAAFHNLGCKHFAAGRVDKAKLGLEIWAEASRNAAISTVQADFHHTLAEMFVAALEKAKAEGAVHPDVDCKSAASVILKLGDGLSVRRATAADFDADREVAEVFAVIGALLGGAIAFPGPGERARDKECSS